MHAKTKVPHLTTELQKVKELVEDTKAKQKANLAKNLRIITSLLTDFISKNQLLLYGGFALNLLLPKKHRIYSTKDAPDFDCISEKPKTMIQKAENLLKSHGFEVFVKQGMHKGTYRLYYEQYGILDITRVMGGTYKKLLVIAIEEKTQASTPMLTVPIMMLKSHMHQELANPYTSIYRLEKVYGRMMLFDQYFPIPDRPRLLCEQESAMYGKPPPKDYQHALQFLHHMVRKHHYPLVGWSAAQLMNGKPIDVWNACLHYKGYFPLEFICLESQLDLLWEHLLHPFQQKFSNASIKKRWYHSDIIPRRLIISISIDRVIFPLAIVFILYDRCYSILPSKIDGFTVGSYDTVLFILHLTYVIFQLYSPSRCAIALALIHDVKQQAEKTYLSKKVQRLSTKCMEIVP